VSCDSNNKLADLVAQMSAGIAGLSNKQAFYAGVAVGAAATGAGAGAYTLAKKQIHKRRWRKAGQTPRPVSQGQKAKPIPGRDGNKRKTKKAKPVPVMPNKKQPRTSGKSPKPIPILAGKNKPSSANSSAQTTPPPAQNTKLTPAAVAVQVAGGKRLTLDNCYRVLRADGSETGLAITPHVSQEAGQPPVENKNAWGVTHLASGGLLSGPHRSVDEAQALAANLATLRLDRAQPPAADVERAKRLIQAYRQEQSS